MPGTGKTTLARALADRFEVPLIAESMRGIADADRDYSAAMERRDSADLQRLGQAMADEFLAWKAMRATEYASHTGFVADRWDADLLDWWLVAFGRGASQVDSFTSQFIDGLVAASASIDLAVLTPVMPPFAGGENDEGNGRLVNMTKHVLSNTLTAGVIRRFTTVPVLELPARPMSVDQRVDAVVAALEARG
jgi:SpoVK/Ycf46/Vps4 family AAA+-type ATPase